MSSPSAALPAQPPVAAIAPADVAAEESCYHCGLPLGGAPVRMELDGRWRGFCCQGCAAAAEIIVRGGLCAYYDKRTAGDGAVAALPAEEIERLHQQWLALADPEFLTAYATPLGDARWSTQIAVEGIHCGACVWLIEQRLRAIPGVLAATVNYSTRRVALQWDATTVQLPQVFQALAEVGYRPLANARHRSELAGRRARRLAILRTLVAWLAMMQVMMFAWPAYIDPAGLSAAERGLFQWASLALTLPALLFSGWPFLAGALRDLRNRRLGMDVPVTLGLWSAFAASLWSVAHGETMVYFDSVAMFLALLLTARLIEDGLRQRSLNAAEELMEQLPAAVRVRQPAGDWRNVAITQVRVGDEVEFAGGGAAPVDGVVVSGESLVDEALLTGESRPVRKSAGDAVLAGSMNRQSPLVVRATRTGGATRIAQMVELMQHALASKPSAAQIADVAAQWFTAGLLVVAAMTVALWWWLDPARIVPTLVAVLVVSCPCALSLAVPAALAASTARLSRHGVLLARGHALDRAPRVDVWLFDKTGTLTTTEPVVARVTVLDAGFDEHRLLALARAVEEGVQHPLARAFAASVPDGVPPETVADLHAVAHGGIQATWLGRSVRLGNAAFSGVEQAAMPPDDRPIAVTRVGLSLDGHAIAVFDIAETLRPGAAEAIAALRRGGAEVAMLSGDAPRTVRAWADRLGIAEAEGGLTPQDKLDRVRRLRQQGKVVAMVGDGVNDAPVLAAADLSVSFAGATPIARAGADVILHHPDLRALRRLVEAGRRTVQVMRQNLVWAVVYNLVAIPLAIAGLITPLWAAVGMSSSSLLVVSNAARLARRERAVQP